MAFVAPDAACAESDSDKVASDQEWALHGLTSDEARFSPLDEINRQTVKDLSLAWSYATGTHRGLEATPLMVDGVLYATASWSIVFALDARTGKELWRFDPEVPRWKGRHACCDVVNRGVAEKDGRIYVGTIDGRLIALDGKTGKPMWSVKTADPGKPYTITGAPRIVKDLVLIGNGGADLGVRGYFSAYSATTGELAWRFYTVPASKAGPHEHPELEQAAATWSADSLWETGLGGTAWDSMVYDPELDLLYVGTGNASIYDREKRSPGGGDNLYLASILALRPDSGELVWHYQTTPGEHWDYTATQHMILAELSWQGRMRKVLMQAPKNGFFYVLDRTSGELLSAEKFVHASWASHVDLETGRPVERKEAQWSQKDAMVSPAPMGGHSWHPMSFHPETGLVYIPAMENVHAYLPSERFRYRAGAWNTGEDFKRLTEGIEDYPAIREIPCGLTRLIAWDPKLGQKAWEVQHDSGVLGGTLATAGGLVFQGAGQGRFAAFDAASGERHWQIDVGIDVMAPPITYRLDGEQFVAVLAGVGGSAGNHLGSFEHDNAGRVLAFKLDGQAAMPMVRKRQKKAGPPPPLDVPEETIATGRAVYADNCSFCHGFGLKASGLYPDLRAAGPAVHENWNAIVIGGLRSASGMPSFADLLSSEEAEAVRAYVLHRAARKPGLLEKAVNAVAEQVCVPVSWITN
ncbi:MAG: PQQ-dependent dehydrogenase, methanol/ethanol family [Myxococcota bacterium]